MLPAKQRSQIIKLQQKKYRKLNNEFIVEGEKGVEEAIKKNAEIVFIVVSKKYLKEKKAVNFLGKAKEKGIEIYDCDESEIKKIKTTATFPGISAVVKYKNFELKDLTDGKPIFAFDKINDPGNLGTIIRTADWFGFNNILISEDSVDPYNDKCVRSTMGSIFGVKLYTNEGISKSINSLKKKGYKIISLDMKGDSLDKIKPIAKTVYLFGSESHGLDKRLEKFIDKSYTIKGKGEAESLNLAVSAGILMSKI